MLFGGGRIARFDNASTRTRPRSTLTMMLTDPANRLPCIARRLQSHAPIGTRLAFLIVLHHNVTTVNANVFICVCVLTALSAQVSNHVRVGLLHFALTSHPGSFARQINVVVLQSDSLLNKMPVLCELTRPRSSFKWLAEESVNERRIVMRDDWTTCVTAPRTVDFFFTPVAPIGKGKEASCRLRVCL